MPYKDKEKQKAFQRDRLSRRRARWLQENGPCVECFSVDHLEVDHVDPLQKVTHRVWSWSQSRLEEELAKCQVLCRDCHQEKTKKQFIKYDNLGRKWCPTCMAHLDLSAFQKNKSKWDGLCTECRECNNERIRISRSR